MTASHDHGQVVSLAGSARYRPDYKSLASAQVRTARERLRLDRADFARHLAQAVGWQVRPEVIELWEQSVGTPPGDVVLACAVAAQGTPGDVLAVPLTAHAGRQAALMSAAAPALAQDPSETVEPYADRGLITRQQWNDIIRDAKQHLWLYGMAEHGYAMDDEVPPIVEQAAARGCDVRVLLLSPEYPGITDIDEGERNPPGTLAARIRASAASFLRMQETAGPGMQVRVFADHPAVSIVRGDDHMLVTPYLRYANGDNSPTLGLSARSAPRMFGRYARHFDSMWDLAVNA